MDVNHIFAIQCFISLFIIIDPVGNVPVFLSLMERFSHRDRRGMVRNAVIIAAPVLIMFTILGPFIFDFLKIDIYSFKIAGGLLISMIALEMLFGRRSRTKFSSNMEEEVGDKEDLAITPLAIPLLTGPGAITTSIVLFNSASEVDKLVLIACILLVFGVSYLILSRAEVIFRFLGRTGTKVFVRLMGLMLFAIAVQFIIDGIRDAALIIC